MSPILNFAFAKRKLKVFHEGLGIYSLDEANTYKSRLVKFAFCSKIVIYFDEYFFTKILYLHSDGHNKAFLLFWFFQKNFIPQKVFYLSIWSQIWNVKKISVLCKQEIKTPCIWFYVTTRKSLRIQFGEGKRFFFYFQIL